MIKAIGLTLLCILLLIGGSAAFAAWAWHDVHAELDRPNANRSLEIARGESLEHILGTLHDHGVIDQTIRLRLYLKMNKLEPVVQAGFYTFPSPISPLGVLDVLKKGGGFGRLTVIEGWTRFEIADAMTKIPSFKLSSRDEALKLFNNVALIRDLDPGASNLEGYLFPDTYFIVADTDPHELVKQMVQRFRQVWGDRLQQKSKQAKRGIRAVVTEASLIETEAKLKTERPVVASVIENRLRKGMTLSLDSTLIYAAKLAGTWKNDGKVYQSDIDRKSPYNTRQNKGLPPGPIASPGRSSLEAAVKPSSTSYIYYVRNPDRNDGAHNFYSDSKHFETGVQALRRWEQRHPSNHR